MGNNLSALHVIYDSQRKRFEEGGHSPAQKEAYKKTVELIDSSSTDEEWKEKMESEKQWDVMTAASRSDYYNAMAAAFEETHYGSEVAEAYRALARAYLDGADAGKIEELEDNARMIQEKSNKSFRLMYSVLTAVIEYYSISDFFTLEKKTILEEFEEDLSALGGFDAFVEMVNEERYSSRLPFGEDRVSVLVEKGKAMCSAKLTEYEPDSEETKWAETQQRILLNSLDKVHGAEKECREKTVYRLFAVDNSSDSPGDYEFELFWEKEGEE